MDHVIGERAPPHNGVERHECKCCGSTGGVFCRSGNRPCTPGSGKTTPIPCRTHQQCQRRRQGVAQVLANGSTVQQGLVPATGVMDSFRYTEEAVGDMSEGLMELTKDAAAPEIKSVMDRSSPSALCHLRTELHFWRDGMLLRILYGRSMRCTGSSSVWATQSMSQPRMTWPGLRVNCPAGTASACHQPVRLRCSRQLICRRVQLTGCQGVQPPRGSMSAVPSRRWDTDSALSIRDWAAVISAALLWTKMNG